MKNDNTHTESALGRVTPTTARNLLAREAGESDGRGEEGEGGTE